jgi:hypothetical protein
MDAVVAGIGGQVIGRQMRVTPHHLLGHPPAELLQREDRRPVLHVPRGPRVAQIVEAEVLDTGALERVVPSPRTDLLYRTPFVRED